MGGFDKSNSIPSCENIEDLLDGYFDSELSDDEQKLVDQHLANCSSCTNALTEIKSVASILNNLADEPLEKDFSADVDKILDSAFESAGVEAVNCDEVLASLDEYHDNELAKEKRPSIEAHLENCDNCFKALASIQSISSLLRSIPKETLEVDFAERVDDLLEAKDNATVNQANVVPFGRKAALAFAAALLLLAIAGPTIIDSFTSSSIKTANKQEEKIEMVATDPKPEGNNKVEENKTALEESNNRKEIANIDIEKDTIEKTTIAKEPPAKDKKIEINSVDDNQIATKPIKQNKVIPVAPPIKATPISQDQLLATEAVVAYDSDEDDDLFSQMGVSTDEDGLYAIKL